MKRQINGIVFVSFVAVAGMAAIATAADAETKKDVTQMRGPLDVHATWVRQIVETLELTDAQRTDVKRVIDDGHTAWRKWFEANHERVAAHTKAVQDPRASGDKTQLKEAMREKKAFMHTAPSIFRHPDPVRDALPESLRAEFATRLEQRIKEVHQRPPAESGLRRATKGHLNENEWASLAWESA